MGAPSSQTISAQCSIPLREIIAQVSLALRGTVVVAAKC